VSLPAFSVRQLVLVNLIFALLMLAGLQFMRRIPVDLFPDISFNNAKVITVWSGASPEEVERLLTKKLEDAASRATACRRSTSSGTRRCRTSSTKPP
jgi:HAE1 family hydrophobic/amphiphilic exporter-1